MPKKRPMVATVENLKGVKGLSSKKMHYNRREIRRFLVLPFFPYGTKKAVVFLGNGFRTTSFAFQN